MYNKKYIVQLYISNSLYIVVYVAWDSNEHTRGLIILIHLLVVTMHLPLHLIDCPLLATGLRRFFYGR